MQYTYDLVGKVMQVNDPTGTYGFAYDNMARLVGTSCVSPKFRTGEKSGSRATVDNFVTAKVSSFNRVQPTSRARLQAIQQESIDFNKAWNLVRD